MALLDFFKKKQTREKLTRPTAEVGSNSVKHSEHGPAEEHPDEPSVAVLPAGSSKMAGILLERPHITEKTARLAETGTYVFRVASDAASPAIRKAVEELYRVRVRRVNVVSVPSRKVTYGRHPGRRPGFRKALVTLEKGQTIEFV